MSRIDKVRDAIRDRRGASKDALVLRTRGGEVVVSAIKVGELNGVPVVEVWLNGATESGETHFRIINPPTLVRDPSGPIKREDGRTFREDPLAALAEIVAGNGGRRR